MEDWDLNIDDLDPEDVAILLVLMKLINRIRQLEIELKVAKNG